MTSKQTHPRRLATATAPITAMLSLVALLLGLMALPAAVPADPSAHAALATNPVGTCPYWSELDTSGTLKGKTPQAIAISKRQVSSTEWEVSGRATHAGVSLYSGMVQILANKPPFGWGLVRYVWLHGHGREMVARFPLEPGQIFRSVVCGRHPHVLPPGVPYTGPGSSCKKPIKSFLEPSYQLGGIPAGVERHIPIIHEIRNQGTADYFIGAPPVPGRILATYVTVSFSSDPSVIICKATLQLYDEKAGTMTHHVLPTGAHEDTPFVVGETEGSFRVTVEGRYVKGRP